ncbi:MAG: hypothetical protein ACREHD_30785, partial [Pirellulales bacterium]
MSTLLSLLLTAVCFSDKLPEEAGGAKPSTAIEDFKADAKQYVMRLDSRPDADFELREEPLFHWSNPARLGEDGAVFVWMLQG